MALKNSFTLSRIDDINLKKYNLKLKDLKKEIKEITQILLDLEEIKTNKIFLNLLDKKINKLKFDISFCNDNTIQEINKEYRNKDKPTDVITFSLFADDKNSIAYRKTADLGQIIISIETAVKQAQENNKPSNTTAKNTINLTQKEILTLTCHGILHLIGFDHLTKKDYDFVVKVQNKVMGKYEQISIKKF